MKAFATMITALGTSTKTNEKLELLSDYFKSAPEADKVWTIALFSGRRPKRLISSAYIRLWANEITGLPAWLFEVCFDSV